MKEKIKERKISKEKIEQNRNNRAIIRRLSERIERLSEENEEFLQNSELQKHIRLKKDLK